MQEKLRNIYKRIKSMIMTLVPSLRGETSREFRFYKESNGRWYVDLPEWRGGKWNLEMVEGADELLEYLKSDYKNDVRLFVSLQPFDDASVLEKIADDLFGDGADYKVVDSNEEIWLCGVTSWYYGYMPDKIYYRKVLD